ncbi:SDR family NAD(P)-dependent oxidoreductase [Ottowia thiooxydans]|uniref:SDR family NAD(P)-dependent oxidoreductase n=1 Tax=Ottowia thiooxydans TaxID=219182 RepID=UPI00042863DE|nr:SDR family oxidoreductase [Ottowia thiooxydans]
MQETNTKAELRAGGQGVLSLKDKVAVVTGASSGIGEATARRLAEAGARVIVGYNEGEERARKVLASLPGEGHAIQKITLTDTRTIEAAAAAIKASHGRVDVLVNSAGIAKIIPHADVQALDDATFDHIMVINARGPFAVIRTFLPLLQVGTDSVIVNVSSISAFTALGSSIAYCASKAALDTMSMSLARVLGPNIRVVGISPAAVATPILPELGRARVEKQAALTPLKTVTEPDDIALSVMAAVTHLRLMTGSTIVVDGGRHL